MQGAHDLFFSFVVSERSHHARRLRSAGLLCILISALISWTQWLALRPGLAILLAGQAGVVVALFSRNRQLSRTLGYAGDGAIQRGSLIAWFKGEELFVRRLAFFESLCQIIGFVVLGYAFWVATGVWFALAIGIVYPVTMYFGITRRRNMRAIRQLVTKQKEIATLLEHPCPTTGTTFK